MDTTKCVCLVGGKPCKKRAQSDTFRCWSHKDRTLFYVLEDAGKAYVGKSMNVLDRIEKHDNKHVVKHNLTTLVRIGEMRDRHYENTITNESMYKYGINNVRGGRYATDVIFENTQKDIAWMLGDEYDMCGFCGEPNQRHSKQWCPNPSGALAKFRKPLSERI